MWKFSTLFFIPPKVWKISGHSAVKNGPKTAKMRAQRENRRKYNVLPWNCFVNKVIANCENNKREKIHYKKVTNLKKKYENIIFMNVSLLTYRLCYWIHWSTNYLFFCSSRRTIYLVYRNTVQNVWQQSILFMYDNKSYLFAIDTSHVLDTNHDVV